MPVVQLNKNGYFVIFLVSLVLLILWNSRVDLPPPKQDGFGYAVKDKSKDSNPFGGLGEKQEDDTPSPPAQELVEAAPAFPPSTPEGESPFGGLSGSSSDTHSDSNPPAVDPNSPQSPPEPFSPPTTPPTDSSSSPSTGTTADLKFANPTFDVHKLKNYKPHNYQGAGHETFATYLSTRKGSMQEPYFQAAQQLVYRILWDTRSKSMKHPITVFVAPHIPEEQRDILTAAGALVRQLDLVEGYVGDTEATKWKDLFSKINMWAQTDFSKITFLDLDAFPLKNIDGVFDLAKDRMCERALLPSEEQANANDICQFVLTGTEAGGAKELNAGMMVFKPNKAMHQYLLHESKKTDQFDNSMAEQPFLNWVFRQNGPFPSEFIDRTWNGMRPQESEKETLKVFHAKLWEVNSEANGALSWASDMFSKNWEDMIALYESKGFESMRAADGTRSYR